MKNSLTYAIPFSFKGERFSPSCTIDLDRQLELGALPCLYRHLANENRIDIYSHEYDVMMMGEVVFERAEGLAEAFFSESHFDFEGFRSAWKSRQHQLTLQAIASQHMNIDDMSDIEGLEASLQAAYQMGLHEHSK